MFNFGKIATLLVIHTFYNTRPSERIILGQYCFYIFLTGNFLTGRGAGHRNRTRVRQRSGRLGFAGQALHVVAVLRTEESILRCA